MIDADLLFAEIRGLRQDIQILTKTVEQSTSMRLAEALVNMAEGLGARVSTSTTWDSERCRIKFREAPPLDHAAIQASRMAGAVRTPK
ncbi:hypothetical protein [Telmatospirillum sp.]|uniref:hypothetical protein n=1 Tax=Telmatospirillum sp. TaxID=2079197 RepID=UPI0028413572|nr:hypothetical protein [Telmatospirillum sp.]MDR3438977.1 hypothetical protein [Telmatospirillum sp.]